MTTTAEPVDPLPPIDDGAATAVVLDVLRTEHALRSACIQALESHPHHVPRSVVCLRLIKFAFSGKDRVHQDLIKALSARRVIDWTQVLAELRKETRPC